MRGLVAVGVLGSALTLATMQWLLPWAAARLVRAQLYGIAPSDPWTLLTAAAISLVTVLAASWLPALRASRVTPVEALRED